ncbi:MAG: ATP-binding protein [Chloroflexota bacterium]
MAEPNTVQNKPKRIPKRTSTAIMNSLGAGVVPRIGLEHINVGRKTEIEALMEDLANVGEGGATFRFVVGRYGSGKTFLLQLMRNQAMGRNFVVTDVDLSPERRLTGSNDAGLNTYRELMQNLSTKARPDGGALAAILDRWISSIQSEVVTEHQVPTDSPEFTKLVAQRIYAVISEMENLVHGFDYAKVIATYWEGYAAHDEDRQNAALRWLRGEYSTKTEARKALDVRVIIQDGDWYEYIKLFASFVSSIGYQGLAVLIDEAVNLYKITHRVSRDNNYEKVLTMFNDTMQGKASHLSIVMGGTPQFVEDPRRGLFSYEALATRLSQSRYSSDGLVDMSGPVLKLRPLDHTEIYLLLLRILEIYIMHTSHDPHLTNEHVQAFMQQVMERIGSDELLTPREVVRDFLSILNLMRQNPEVSFYQLLGGGQAQAYPQPDLQTYQQPGQPYPQQGQPYPQQGQPYPQQGQPYPQQGQPYPQQPSPHAAPPFPPYGQEEPPRDPFAEFNW